VECVAALFHKAQASGLHHTDVIQLFASNGSPFSFRFSVSWHETEKLFFCVGTDVSQLKNANQKQIATERLMQALIENSFEMVGLVDEHFNYLYISDSVNAVFNSKADALLGMTAQQLLGKNCIELVHPDDQPRLAAQMGSVLAQHRKVHLAPYRIQDAQGRWHWLEAIVSNQLANPDIRAIVVSAREVTQQIENEQKLQALQLTEALLVGEEKERARIARDLHDEIAGLIAAAKMHFGVLAQKDMEMTDDTTYQQGMQLLEQAAQQVRRTSHNLMPEILLQAGLDRALQRYCTAISNQSVHIHYICVGDIGQYPANFELALYRIVQELLTNILKHANASEAMVQISLQEQVLSLTIEDNGTGFDTSTGTEGTGLASVKKRVAAMNGQIEVASSTGKGTSIYLEFDMHQNRR
jgi:PAS domain S-box-containing protein